MLYNNYNDIPIYYDIFNGEVVVLLVIGIVILHKQAGKSIKGRS